MLQWDHLCSKSKPPFSMLSLIFFPPPIILSFLSPFVHSPFCHFPFLCFPLFFLISPLLFCSPSPHLSSFLPFPSLFPLSQSLSLYIAPSRSR